MKLAKTIGLSIIVITVFLLSSCETIYNYDLSLYGLDTLPATKSCIQKYIPKSVNVRAGRQKEAVEQIILELDNYEEEIIDSLRADSIFIDTSFNLSFIILALDPNYEATEFDVTKIYYGEEK